MKNAATLKHDQSWKMIMYTQEMTAKLARIEGSIMSLSAVKSILDQEYKETDLGIRLRHFVETSLVGAESQRDEILKKMGIPD